MINIEGSARRLCAPYRTGVRAREESNPINILSNRREMMSLVALIVALHSDRDHSDTKNVLIVRAIDFEPSNISPAASSSRSSLDVWAMSVKNNYSNT